MDFISLVVLHKYYLMVLEYNAFFKEPGRREEVLCITRILGQVGAMSSVVLQEFPTYKNKSEFEFESNINSISNMCSNGPTKQT